jgi:RHS repeat-associated protein
VSETQPFVFSHYLSTFGLTSRPATPRYEDASASTTNSFAYTGRELDATGLYFNRARYYSPSLNRFISEDPLQLGSDSVDLYSFVRNSPPNLTDPSGLFGGGAIVCGSGSLGAVVGVAGTGCAGAGVFPSSKPVYTIALLIFSVAAGAGVEYVRFLRVWTPLERHYLLTYGGTEIAGPLRQNGRYTLLEVVTRKGSRFALDSEVVPVLTDNGEKTFALTSEAAKQEALRLEWHRGLYEYAKLHAFLSSWIYHDQTLFDLARPAFWTMPIVFLVDLLPLCTGRGRVFRGPRCALEPLRAVAGERPKPCPQPEYRTVPKCECVANAASMPPRASGVHSAAASSDRAHWINSDISGRGFLALPGRAY